ncbi:gpi-anchored protein [Lasius niger]|uniref:Regulatory protein zeste n=1 Tax=Lasius niger TaxID=67767 RepID=A0A0J7K917_LASNI|nr:gpi-anchored protein [Lasius niger]
MYERRYMNMEVAQKKTRAPKVSNMQIEYLVAYMQNHIAFATNKLLGAKGKVTHDKQWQHLAEKLNSIGPSKTVENWKKLWFDQRNQARARAAKGKAQRRLTGNIGEPIQLKDSDLKILSIIGGESSVGLPIKEVGLGEQPEDTANPTLILGLTNTSQEIEIIQEQNVYRPSCRYRLSCRSLRGTGAAASG